MIKLTQEQIAENKAVFIDTLRSISRKGCNIEGLINKLESSDFFTAPASTKYHGAFEGGLCWHSLNVYRQMCRLVAEEAVSELSDATGTSYILNNDIVIESDSIKITALLHDFSKMNFYETYVMNKKVYSPNGNKSDEQGRFDWVAVSAYKVRDPENRFIFSTHGHTSEYMTSCFIPLNVDESAAITWHMGGMDAQNMSADVSLVYNQYPLAMLLHLADMVATYIDERV